MRFWKLYEALLRREPNRLDRERPKHPEERELWRARAAGLSFEGTESNWKRRLRNVVSVPYIQRARETRVLEIQNAKLLKNTI